MKIFCDTNIFVAAFLESHPHHAAALPIIERVHRGADTGFIAAHSLAEIYAVLTRLRLSMQIDGQIAWRLIEENILGHFDVVAMSAVEYRRTLAHLAKTGVEGGKTYDALILAAAIKSNAQRIYTFDVAHFQSLADLSLRNRIVSP